MKNLIILSFLVLVGGFGFGQVNMLGDYYNELGDEIRLNADSTFDYSFRYDLSGSWSVGTWKIKSDTIILETLTIHDTIIKKHNKKIIIVSHNQVSERLNDEEEPLIGSSLQNKISPPKKLLFKKNKLYSFSDNGVLLNKKIKSIESKKKVIPWYIKVE